ncbi:hypothetical protein DB35_23535 [Streptomyces abyssalis]|uniref:DUF2993 domain-containing protein n=1 Tax=Streptomyces abyssalis TaxID=933944 RepID=A0A1E7JNU1_9ACTN|nr:DUF2993 domain-containing protein [Streptomyces abyssalis]OEU86655.1 hypothetical protein DB35_23535 [Streptomyces abyssalis]OEU89957.1 hypothetical protein AN215_09995 [Streptomyces abyssalis]OEV29410.1 hypothetical protein AN219_16715 [Streptomyces nanshensis]
MRALRRGLIVLFVLAVLFVAADRLAVKLAEDKAADEIKSAQGIASAGKTSIDIKGFPFLTQVAGKELSQIDADMSGMKAEAPGGELKVSRISARLQDVRLNDDYSSGVANSARGTALVSYDDLTKAALEGVDVGWGGQDGSGKGRLKVSGSVTVLGQTFERSVTSSVSVVGGDTVRVRADKVPGGNIPGLEDAIRGRIDFSRKIAGLPDGIELEKVEPTPEGIELSVRGKDVKLSK